MQVLVTGGENPSLDPATVGSKPPSSSNLPCTLTQVVVLGEEHVPVEVVQAVAGRALLRHIRPESQCVSLTCVPNRYIGVVCVDPIRAVNEVHSELPHIPVCDVCQGLEPVPEGLPGFQLSKAVLVLLEVSIKLEFTLPAEDDQPAAAISLQVAVAVGGRERSVVAQGVPATGVGCYGGGGSVSSSVCAGGVSTCI